MTEQATLDLLVDNVYVLSSPWFRCKRGLILDEYGSVIIDTPVSLYETEMMFQKALVKGKPVRRIVLTHSHFDHSAGCQYLLDGERIAMRGARDWMLSKHARDYLAIDPPEHPDLKKFKITLPTFEIDASAVIHLSKKRLYLFPTPGHSPDSMSVLLEPDGVLFTGDAIVTCFPPIIQDGSSEQAVASHQKCLTLNYKWLIPGHGPIMEYKNSQQHIQTSLNYLEDVRDRVSQFNDPNTPIETIMDSVKDAPKVFSPEIENVSDWHPRVVNKIWSEHKTILIGRGVH